MPRHEAVTTSLSSNRFGVGSVRQGLKIPFSREKLHPPAMPRAPTPNARRNSRRFMERFTEKWLDNPARFLLLMTPPFLLDAKSPHLGIWAMGQKLLGITASSRPRRLGQTSGRAPIRSTRNLSISAWPTALISLHSGRTRVCRFALLIFMRKSQHTDPQVHDGQNAEEKKPK